MNTYSIDMNNGKKYLICGETIKEAIKDSLKYFEKLLEGCTIKKWNIVQSDNTHYILTIEYYNKTPYQVKRLKNKPPVEILTYTIELIEDT